MRGCCRSCGRRGAVTALHLGGDDGVERGVADMCEGRLVDVRIEDAEVVEDFALRRTQHRQNLLEHPVGKLVEQPHHDIGTAELSQRHLQRRQKTLKPLLKQAILAALFGVDGALDVLLDARVDLHAVALCLRREQLVVNAPLHRQRLGALSLQNSIALHQHVALRRHGPKARFGRSLLLLH